VNPQIYQQPSSSSWSGRNDGPNARLFQQIQLLNLCDSLPALPEKSLVLLGFACDEGVKRNLGRPGAAQGPEALRKALGNLPLSLSRAGTLWDAGTILCSDGDLEKAQQFLGKTVASLRERGAFVIVLGGGHEVAWGNFQGLIESSEKTGVLEELAADDAKQGAGGAQQRSVYGNTRAASTDATQLGTSAVELCKNSIDTLNFDAHFDLRPLLAENRGSSGTSFRQIHEECQRKKIAWRYACFGLQHFGNTKELFETAASIKATQCLAETMIHHPQLAHEALETWLASAHAIHLTLCLDVFAAGDAPGVSAPQAFGIRAQELLPFFRKALESGKVIGFDIAELNPTYDRDDQTVKLAAHFVGEVIQKTFALLL